MSAAIIKSFRSRRIRRWCWLTTTALTTTTTIFCDSFVSASVGSRLQSSKRSSAAFLSSIPILRINRHGDPVAKDRYASHLDSSLCLKSPRPSSFSRPPFISRRTVVSTDSTTDDDVKATNDAPVSLTEQIRQSYQQEETDGILQLASSWGTFPEPIHLWQATWEAVNQDKGKAASIFNAWIAAAYCCKNNHNISRWAVELLDLATVHIVPDLVTYSLFYALSNDDTYLLQAQQMAKKKSGTKRRKLLQTSSRKQQRYQSFAEALSQIQTILPEFNILHETDDLVIISKPAGVNCFHKQSTNAGKINKKSTTTTSTSTSDVSLQDALVHKGLAGMLSTLNPDCLGLVHRLDRGTSGCLVLAKNNSMHAKLIALFFTRQVHKQYTAIVINNDDTTNQVNASGVIDCIVHGRPAKSKYEIISKSGNLQRIQVETLTGRKHQVRVHCASGLSSPILGDELYGKSNKDDKSQSSSSSSSSSRGKSKKGRTKHLKGEENEASDSLKIPGIFLHASSLSIPSLNIQVQAPEPSWWESTMVQWKKENNAVARP